MKLELNKNKIEKAVSKAEKIASKSSTLPALECLLLDYDNNTLKIRSTNIDLTIVIELKTKGNEKGKILVPAKPLNSFLSNLPKSDNNVIFETSGSKLHITSETTDTFINTQPVDDFPVVSEEKNDKKFKIDKNSFLKGLNSVWYSTAISSIKPELSSVYIYYDDGDLVFVATDSFRLAEKRVKIHNIENFDDVLIPYRNVIEIVRILDDIDENIELFFREDLLIIQSENIKIISRIIEGNFPDYKQIIPKDSTTEVTLLKEDLIQGIKISNIFSDKFNQVVFSIMPFDNIFEITSNSQEVGETKNSIKGKLEGDNLSISFNSKYIIDCFNSIKSDSIKLTFNGTDKPMIISGTSQDGFLYLVMPMNK